MFDLYNEKRAKNFPWEARVDRKEEKMKQHDNMVYHPQSNLNETCSQEIIIEYLEEKEIIRIEIPGPLPVKWHEEAYDLERRLTVNISDFIQDMLLCKGDYITFPDAVVAFIHHYDGRKKSLTVSDYLNRSIGCMLAAIVTNGIISEDFSHTIVSQFIAKDTQYFTEVLIAPRYKIVEIRTDFNAAWCPESL